MGLILKSKVKEENWEKYWDSDLNKTCFKQHIVEERWIRITPTELKMTLEKIRDGLATVDEISARLKLMLPLENDMKLELKKESLAKKK